MKKTFKTILILVTTMLAISVFTFIILRATVYDPVVEAVPPEHIAEVVKVKESSSLYPTKLSIPALSLSAKVTSVGITKEGNMSTPNNYEDVGWYKYGPMPGDDGSSVIAGHSGNGLGLPAVFSKLDKIDIGDDIYVTNKSGENVHFVVTKISTYNFDDPTGEVFNEEDGQFLKLITCSGSWIREYETHDKRLVVTAIRSMS